MRSRALRLNECVATILVGAIALFVRCAPSADSSDASACGDAGCGDAECSNCTCDADCAAGDAGADANEVDVPNTPFFPRAIDTMKESRDTQKYPLTTSEIADDVNLAASLHTTHLTVDTQWEYASYAAPWVAAVRATGNRVWFRGALYQWYTDATLTPQAFLDAEKSFILANAALFQSGDIFDPCPEPEDSPYWSTTYGPNWSWQPAYPNSATQAFNQFIRDSTDVADQAFAQLGITGVVTTIRSTNTWWAENPGALEQATVTKMGLVTVDSYPEGTTTDPATAATARLNELNTIYAAWHVPVVIGEMGYSNDMSVDDATQDAVLKAEFQAIGGLSYLGGINYWVGAGTDSSGGYTHVFGGNTGAWILRPAGASLSAFYATLP